MNAHEPQPPRKSWGPALFGGTCGEHVGPLHEREVGLTGADDTSAGNSIVCTLLTGHHRLYPPRLVRLFPSLAEAAQAD